MQKVYTTFKLETDPGATVAVAGSFNDWQALPMRECRPGKFSRRVRVFPGRLQYKFMVDGVWMADPECLEWCMNDFGTINSVRRVCRSRVRRRKTEVACS